MFAGFVANKTERKKKKMPLKFNIMHPFSELMAFMLHKMAKNKLKLMKNTPFCKLQVRKQ